MMTLLVFIKYQITIQKIESPLIKQKFNQLKIYTH